MSKQKINSHTYRLFYRGKTVLVRIRRDGKAIAQRFFNLDFTSPVSAAR